MGETFVGVDAQCPGDKFGQRKSYSEVIVRFSLCLMRNKYLKWAKLAIGWRCFLGGAIWSTSTMSLPLILQTGRHFTTFWRYESIFWQEELLNSLSQCILPCIVDFLPKNSVLVHCIRAYLKFRILVGLKCMTESRLERLQTALAIYQKCCKVSSQTNLPKANNTESL
jgi:hypothetical protein